jgi:hypothetical protein
MCQNCATLQDTLDTLTEAVLDLLDFEAVRTGVFDENGFDDNNLKILAQLTDWSVGNVPLAAEKLRK